MEHILETFIFKGNLCEFKDIRNSEHLGIVIIHQELALIPIFIYSRKYISGK